MQTLTSAIPVQHSNQYQLASQLGAGHLTGSFPIMHLICPPPPPPPPHQILRSLCFSFLLGVTAVPREIENNAYAKF